MHKIDRATKAPPVGKPPNKKEMTIVVADSHKISEKEMLRLEYERNTAIKETTITRAEPLLTKVENMGSDTEPILRRMPKLSFACRRFEERARFASPENKATKRGAMTA